MLVWAGSLHGVHAAPLRPWPLVLMWRCEHFEVKEVLGSLESTGELGLGPHAFKINVPDL